MFARVKKSGRYEYLQIVENRRVGKKTVQRVISTIKNRQRATGVSPWVSTFDSLKIKWEFPDRLIDFEYLAQLAVGRAP